MVDPYPPFTLDDDPGYPVRFDIDYPEQGVDRWRPLVALAAGDPLRDRRVPDLSTCGRILVFFAFFTILFTKTYPGGHVQHRPDQPAVAGEGERVRELDGDPVPAVRLGLSTSSG